MLATWAGLGLAPMTKPAAMVLATAHRRAPRGCKLSKEGLTGTRARAKTKKEQKRKVAEEAKDNAALQATLELLRADSFRQTRKRREKEEADAPVSE